MLTVEAPTTRDEIIHALEQLQRQSKLYWDTFTADEFFRPLGQAWSPAENVRHLTKSVRPVAQALGLPRAALRLAFGRAKRPSRTFDEVRTTYLGVLAAGAQAGRFAPRPQKPEADAEAWRARIMAHHEEAVRALIVATGKWSEAMLDRYQLPHPLIGKLTAREMLFFTLYHNLHHVHVVERRRAEQEQQRFGEATTGL